MKHIPFLSSIFSSSCVTVRVCYFVFLTVQGYDRSHRSLHFFVFASHHSIEVRRQGDMYVCTYARSLLETFRPRINLMSYRFLDFCVIGRLGRPPCCTRIFSHGLQGYLPHEFQSAHSIEAISQQLLPKCRCESTSSQLLVHVSNQRLIFARHLIISWPHDIQPHIELSCRDLRTRQSTETKVVPACCIGSIPLLVIRFTCESSPGIWLEQ